MKYGEIAALILAFVFGTLAFLLPLIFAAAAIPTTLGIIWIFAHLMELTTYLQNLVMLIGLGIAIDYSLLIVYRYREELRSGKSKEDAIVRTMETAGRAVVFSGSAVGIGLALMLFMPLPFMRGFGIGGLVIPLVSVVCALTLLPVLYTFGGFGEAPADVPADLRQALLGLVAHWFEHRDAVIVAGSGTVVPTGFDRMVAAYKRVRL